VLTETGSTLARDGFEENVANVTAISRSWGPTAALGHHPVSKVMLTAGTQAVTSYPGAAARAAAHAPGRHRFAAIGVGR
jgi:hypothetical protein